MYCYLSNCICLLTLFLGIYCHMCQSRPDFPVPSAPLLRTARAVKRQTSSFCLEAEGVTVTNNCVSLRLQCFPSHLPVLSAVYLLSPSLRMQDVGLMDGHLLRHDEAVHEGPLCSSHQMGKSAGDIPATQQACNGSNFDQHQTLLWSSIQLHSS